MKGTVSLVGAGPWDPELLTLAGRDRLAAADAVIADYLVNPAILVHCRPDTRIYQRVAGPHSGPRLDQDAINALMVERAKAGDYVVRLKGGDPMVFGRGAEEARYLREHGIQFEFLPGVSSAIAAPEAAGIPITHRDHTPSFSVVSGFEAYDKAGLSVAWEHLAKNQGTLVLLMSVRNLRANAERLVDAGRPDTTPTAVIRWGTRGIQRTVVGTLADIGDKVDAAGLRAPAVLVVGDVVSERAGIQWFEHLPLYGKRVVVTRAHHQAEGLIRRLAAHGADAVAFPCLGVAPPEDSEPLAAALSNLGRYDGVIVSSPNGVQALLTGLSNANTDLRALAGKTVAVIGTGTAAKCQAHGLRPDVIPAEARSEGLIDTLKAQGDLGRRWLHIRADEGRGLIGDAIRGAGGTVDLVVGYRTIRPEVPALLLRSLAPASEGGEGYDAVCFASGKAARHFLTTVGEALGEELARARLAAARVICIGPVTTKAVEALGVRVDRTADDPSDEGLLRATVDVLSAKE